jgi:hypothetical protein
MEWYEIVGVVVMAVIGVWIRGAIYEFRRNYFYNDSWRRRDRK